MALTFQGVQPVTFGDRDCVPNIDTETKMRLSQIQTYNDETDEILASAFPKDESYVKRFLKDQMTAFEKQKLHAYLVGGIEMVRRLDDEIDEKFHEIFDKVEAKGVGDGK